MPTRFIREKKEIAFGEVNVGFTWRVTNKPKVIVFTNQIKLLLPGADIAGKAKTEPLRARFESN
ncbi:hypothetical protein PZBJ_07340 [Pantoea endophytica]|uniref:Uncharacterized protein n=1 Tax=Pantoea endophytica TaxID=92488 RepID=A0ABX4SVA6_9GAMM|nr:hypothetical protein PZBJ_07340 [Pantoea endophytica]